ncbi:dihydrofolate reductase [Phascolarctid gammaherpesvirus 1]|uniref:Viral dihydrofolate reductase n=1 Tax=Phascolarctid gammaherpesvirus 1 TaxID=2249313 RepID=A0A3S8D7J5_9GAMA|nr:dihydrofolate reductase [Phascolarctid gammaherpesvirus 1]AZB49177.1 dihydrofolate reductase [Phascolarctid gammaherpesvirus 1]
MVQVTGSYSPMNCIVAVDSNMGIGKDGRMPWPTLRQDLRHFHKLTRYCAGNDKINVVIMGKNTWFSLPCRARPLPGRINVVLSKTLKNAPLGAHYLAHSLEHALDIVGNYLSESVFKIWIIGGSSLYREALSLPSLEKIYITRIFKEFQCDVFFPAIDQNIYKMINDPEISGDLQREGDINYRFEVYEKIQYSRK